MKIKFIFGIIFDAAKQNKPEDLSFHYLASIYFMDAVYYPIRAAPVSEKSCNFMKNVNINRMQKFANLINAHVTHRGA